MERKLFPDAGLETKLLLGATVVGSSFAFLLSLLRLLTDAHMQHFDLSDRIAFIRFAYQLNEQAHNDLLGIIIVAYLLVFVTSLLLYPFLLRQQNALKQLALDNMRARLETLIIMGNTIAKRDSDTSEHNYRVTLYAIHLAKVLQIPEETMPDLIVGAFLHDIGKIAIPDKILLKPSPLDEEETRIMRTHVMQGLDILHHSSFLGVAGAIVGGHHERYCGNGYPGQLAGDAIPSIVRIFSIVDVFDALTSKRPYKQPFSQEVSLRLMAEESGRAFDPEYLKVFLLLAPELYRTYALVPEEVLFSALRKLALPIVVRQYRQINDLP